MLSDAIDVVLGFEIPPRKEISSVPSGASRILSDYQGGDQLLPHASIAVVSDCQSADPCRLVLFQEQWSFPPILPSARPAAHSYSGLLYPAELAHPPAQSNSRPRMFYVLPSTVIDMAYLPPLAVGRSSIAASQRHGNTMHQSADERHRNEKDTQRCAQTRYDGSDELIRISRDQPVTYQSICTSQSKINRSNIPDHQHKAKIS